MNTRIEVDHYAGEDSAWTAEAREADRKVATGNHDGIADSRPRGDDRADRLSVDPLRGTDRYRLVAPLTLRI